MLSWSYGRFTVSYATVSITIIAVSLNLIHGGVYSIQYYVIKFVSDLRQIGVFLQVFQLTPPIKLTTRYNWDII